MAPVDDTVTAEHSHKSQVTQHKHKHTGLGSSSIIAHVVHSPPPPPANSFVIGPAVINTPCAPSTVFVSAQNQFLTKSFRCHALRRPREERESVVNEAAHVC
jgi:hypothetical protein